MGIGFQMIKLVVCSGRPTLKTWKAQGDRSPNATPLCGPRKIVLFLATGITCPIIKRVHRRLKRGSRRWGDQRHGSVARALRRDIRPATILLFDPPQLDRTLLFS